MQRYADNLNQWANEVDDLVVNIQRANAMNQRANVVAEQMRAQQEAQIQQQAEAQNQTQTPYHQRNIEDVFAEFTHNGLDENDFNNFVESNLQQANDELNQLKANPFKMGADFQQGLAEKKAYQEKLADAQARFDYWTQAKKQQAESVVILNKGRIAYALVDIPMMLALA
ncbi:hypothetical protein GVX76_01680 [[Haemophilus] felis]|nr:hypothetical protein [[Haemophilus] felis]